ncbi:hypothetical protein D3C72_1459780 [compost metagenome]
MYGAYDASASFSLALPASTISGTRTEGDICISPRRLRVASVKAFSCCIHASADSSILSVLAIGYGCIMIESPSALSVLPAKGATVCHSASVTNGMIGWARRSTTSSTRSRVWRVARCWPSVPCCTCTLATSRYQSQYSSQTNL